MHFHTDYWSDKRSGNPEKCHPYNTLFEVILLKIILLSRSDWYSITSSNADEVELA